MEDSKPAEEGDRFFDALDDFPFFDCPSAPDSEGSAVGPSASSPEYKLAESTSNASKHSSAGSRYRHRRSLSQRIRHSRVANVSEDSKFSSAGESELSTLIYEEASTSGFKEDKRKYGNVKDPKGDGAKLVSDKSELKSERVGENGLEGKSEASTITSSINDRIDNVDETTSSASVRRNDANQYNVLVSLAELVIRAVSFQVFLLISFIMFPLRALYFSIMFMVSPFHTMKRGKDYMTEKVASIWNIVREAASPFMSDWMKEHRSVLSMVFRCGWAVFWSLYVCFVLIALLVSAFVMSGLMMRRVVEEPFQLEQPLNFDYTKNSPVAYVPITSCAGMIYADSVRTMEVDNAGEERVISPKHKLQVTVELLLPESDYNRNLGMFQVRVEFLSSNGKTLASLSHPCMLQFKSEPIRLLLTFFKVLPLATGYASESQTIKLNFKGFAEGDLPTGCVKVLMEQRAEYRPGAGVPEVYDAHIILESELPLIKRILWSWRKTIFVWLGMTLFVMELIFTLVCCRPLLMPRMRGHSGGGSHRSTLQANDRITQR